MIDYWHDERVARVRPDVPVTAAPGAAARSRPRPRPRNRRQLIVDAACRAFSSRGYHAASMEDIAARVGISAAALYRHFPNKYALFAECAHVTAGRLAAAADAVPPGASLAELLAALIRVTVAHRASGGFYRWEARYLNRDDRQALRGTFARVTGRVTEAVRREHPGPEEGLRAAAALGVIGSATAFRVSVPRRRLEDTLLAASAGVSAADLRPAPGPAASNLNPAASGLDPAVPGRAVELPVELPAPGTRRDEILTAAIPLFARYGFASVTNGQIAERAGLTPSALYRHYPAKVDILVAACLRAADLLSAAVTANLRDTAGPRQALAALAATYVAYSFEHTALTSVADGEIAGLPGDLRRPLIDAQRAHIDVWERWLRAARPELDPDQARALAHAALGAVLEAGRRLRWQDTARHRELVTALVLAALGL